MTDEFPRVTRSVLVNPVEQDTNPVRDKKQVRNSTVTATVEARASQALPTHARRVIATLLVAAFVVILNETIMGVALPRLMTELHISAATVQWLSTAFMLTMAVVIPTTGFLLQRIPSRTVFIIAMSLFCAGTLVAGLAPGFWLLLPARIIQASGTAMMVPLLMTSILTLVPIQRRGAVMGNVSIAISVAPAIGPTLSGLILQFLSWRFMFLLVLPVALVSLAIGARQLENFGQRGNQRLDVLSVLLSIPAFGGIVYGLSQFAVSSGSGIGVAAAVLAVGLACLVLFGWRQIQLQRSGDPLLDLRVFKIKMFSLSVVLLCIAMMALFGALILLPIYLQSIRGLSSLETGFLLLPGGLLMGLLAPTVGRIFDRYGPKVLVPPGALLIVLNLLGLTQVDQHTPAWMLVGLHVILCLGFACLFTPAFTTGLNPLPPALYSHGSATMATLQQVAGAAGTALLVTIMAGRTINLVSAGTPRLAAEVVGMHTAFAVATAVAVLAAGLSLFLRNSKPAHL
jgi:DHA2 family lincomycin resistance protein-like MFS transporter